MSNIDTKVKFIEFLETLNSCCFRNIAAAVARLVLSQRSCPSFVRFPDAKIVKHENFHV
jgi:hypothetical protein